MVISRTKFKLIGKEKSTVGFFEVSSSLNHHIVAATPPNQYGYDPGYGALVADSLFGGVREVPARENLSHLEIG
jgi:hypothetical protein